MDCEPVFDYGTKPVHWEYAGPGYNEGSPPRPARTYVWACGPTCRIGFEGAGAPRRATA